MLKKAIAGKFAALAKMVNICRVKLYFGFQEKQDVGCIWKLFAKEGITIDQQDTSFFIGSENISFRRKSPMPKWRRHLFRFLTRNSSSAIEYFQIPVEHVVEIGIQIEL